MLQLQSFMDPAQWNKANAEYARLIKKAENQAIHDVGFSARNEVRKMIEEAGFGPTWQNAIQVRFGFNEGSLYNPFALIYSKIGIASVFETGATIAGKPFLWLPTDNVPSIKGRPHMTPKEYVENVGPLVTMRRPGGLPMLGAPTRVAKSSSRAVRRAIFTRATLKRGTSRRQKSTEETVTIPMFVAVSSVTIPKKWDVHGTVVDVAATEISGAFESAMEKYDGGA